MELPFITILESTKEWTWNYTSVVCLAATPLSVFLPHPINEQLYRLPLSPFVLGFVIIINICNISSTFNYFV
jgi:hypothetical protein